MSIINITDLYNFVSDKTFEQLKKFSKELRIKHNDNLYLLVDNKNKEENKENKENKENEENKEEFLSENIKKQANGIIFEMETNNIVAMCYPQIDDVKNEEQLNELINNDSITVEYCEDGTIIRLYCYNDKWYTSTTKCIDASISFWSSSKSFNELFWDLFDKNDLENLDKNSTYFFILLHKENRIVVKHKKNALIYVSKVNNKTQIEDNEFIFERNPNIKMKEYINKNEFQSIINSNKPFDLSNKRGIVIRVKDINTNISSIYKIDFESYKIIKDIRGNVAEIRLRYIELLNKPESLELLEKIYKEYQFTFAFIKASILKLVKTIHRLYIKSHVKHEIQIGEDHIYYRTLRQLHAQYKNTNTPIRFEDVYNKIVNLDKHVIKRFLNWV
jgi:hypothetical protein